MLAAGKGVIVTMCSVNAVLSDPFVIDYSAAKAVLASFSKALSKEVAGKGVRVNTISPGPVETDLWLGDQGSPEEVAALVVVLASDVGRTSPAPTFASTAALSLRGRNAREIDRHGEEPDESRQEEETLE